MAIEWRLRVLMAERHISVNELCERTGINKSTISKLRHRTPGMISMNVMDKLCEALDCQPGELIIYIPRSTSQT